MSRKKPKVNLSQQIQPRSGDLEQLFASDEDSEQSAGMQLMAIRLDVIEPDPSQPRSTFSDTGLTELAESIRQDGVIQPIEVTQIGRDRYLIVHGERRWRAARQAGLATIPAVVRRRDYDEVTRFVRQVVENIQREDLNDVDRAAALLRLRELLQEELDAGGPVSSGEPWAGKVTWAKVGARLGYSRQRIHQLIKLLDLPDEIKEAVRSGDLSERDTRVYQQLTQAQQRALHRARMAGDLERNEVRDVARLLREAPTLTVSQALRLVRRESSDLPGDDGPLPARRPYQPDDDAYEQDDLARQGVVPARAGRPSSIERLDWVRGHLARVDRRGLTPAERKEMVRLLYLIEQDVRSLLLTLESTSDDF